MIKVDTAALCACVLLDQNSVSCSDLFDKRDSMDDYLKERGLHFEAHSEAVFSVSRHYEEMFVITDLYGVTLERAEDSDEYFNEEYIKNHLLGMLPENMREEFIRRVRGEQ